MSDVKILRETLEAMANTAGLPFALWNEHSNAALRVAARIEELEAIKCAAENLLIATGMGWDTEGAEDVLKELLSIEKSGAPSLEQMEKIDGD